MSEVYVLFVSFISLTLSYSLLCHSLQPARATKSRRRKKERVKKLSWEHFFAVS